MAVDHFQKWSFQENRKDWNFNILFNDQPQVAALVHKYEPLINHPGLHKPVPTQWLHATVLRVGFLEDFTAEQMLKVTELLAPKLADMKMPKLMLGQWWIWNGGPVLHVTPDQDLKIMFNHLLDALTQVIGQGSLPSKLQFIPHVTLAYPKTHNDELGLYRQMQAKPMDGVEIRAKRLSLIKQRIEDDYYAWDVIKEVPIGQA